MWRYEYAAMLGTFAISRSVWRSRDAGESWERLTKGLPEKAHLVVLREAMATPYKGLKVVVADGECMLEQQRKKRPVVAARLERGERVVRTRFGGKKTNWLLIKEKDAHARPGSDVTAEKPRSVLSGRDLDDPKLR